MRARVTAALVVLAMGALPACAGAAIHVVARGESLTSVAATDGLSVAALAQANGLSPNAELLVGEVIQIPSRNAQTEAGSSSSGVTSSTQATSSSSVAQTADRAYVVQWGDTLSGIAARAGTTVAQLASLNDLNPNHVLLAGSVLRLSGAASSSSGAATYVSDDSSTTSSGGSRTTATTQGAGPDSTQAAGPDSTQAAGPDPTAERASSGELAEIAESDGVPASLAEAVAWQESGWNNDVVSGIGAVGVMQIVPSTWTWIDQYLTPDDPLAPASAASNIRGGVLLLHDLLLLTGDNYAEAVAGYYQGLQSVEKHGMYADTKQYVADVLALAQRFSG